MERMTTSIHEVNPIAFGADAFVVSAILDDIRKEIKDTKGCPCDDYDICAYENSD